MKDPKIYNIRDFQEKRRHVNFSTDEMNALLTVYAARVNKGDWMDYAIEQRNGIIAFSVFSNIFDAPAYTVAKCSKAPRGGGGQYLLLSGAEKLVQSESLNDIIAYFHREYAEKNTKPSFIRLVKA